MEKVCTGPRVRKEPRFKKMHQELTTIESLPREIAINILSRPHITTLVHVKLVSHSWHSFVQDPLLATMHFSRWAKTEEIYRSLILHCDLPIQNHLYSIHFSDANIETMTRIHMCMISEFVVVGSCNELLCLWHSLYKDEWYIYNPFTRYYIKLPKPEQFRPQKRVALGFGFHPTTKEFKVVRIVYYQNEDNELPLRRYPLPESEVQVLTLGNGSSCFTWRSKGKTAYQLIGMPYPSQVLVNGTLHWLTMRRRYQSLLILVFFDLADEQFREVPNPSRERFGRHCSQFVILRGCLSAVLLGFRKLYIWVMKEYGVRESWVKEFSIAASLPSPYLDQSSIVKLTLKLPKARILCFLRNGEIVLQYNYKSLISYDSKSVTFKKLTCHDLPERFNAIVHIGSLNWIDSTIDL